MIDAPLDELSAPLRRAVAAAFPDRTVAAVDRPGGSGHPGNDVLRVDLAGDPGRAYLKVATDGAAGRRRIARDAALTRYVGRHAPVRTAAVLAADPDGDPPYLATAPLSGERLVDRLESDGDGVRADSLVPVLRRVGAATAGLHAARFDRAGAVVGGDADRLELDHDPWPTVLREGIVGAHSVPDRFEDLPERAADLVRSRADDLRLAASGGAHGPAAVVHDDLHAENVFDGDRPGVIDFESGTVGDPGFDLARTEDLCVDGRPGLSEAERRTVRTAFRDGYRAGASAHGVPVASDGLPHRFGERRPVYRAVAFLRTAVTFERWAVEAPEPVDELAAWVREEFDRRVEAAGEGGDG